MIKKELINNSIDYIIEHFHEGISVEDVSSHFHFSKYYFCRSFKAHTGESVYEFINRLKLNQSAVDIKLNMNTSITEIGLDYGYDLSNYSAAFKNEIKMSPVEFKKSVKRDSIENPFYKTDRFDFDRFDDYNAEIKIIELSPFQVIYERLIGNYGDIKDGWFKFIEKYQALINDDTLMIEKFYNDPAITDIDKCICDLCITIKENNNLENQAIIKPGLVAIYRYEGEIKDIFNKVQGIFAVWLPKSDYMMRERFGLNIYNKFDKDNNGVVMDICIPIKKSKNS